jgi:CheY-like chemotaxis protein/HPt (histidine-containing phosphotransfer) domain-containing protein
LLKKRGHTVVVAGNGREALAILEKSSQPFDVLLMDIQMPDMGGFEATAIIREREKESGGHLPIVALTAHATSDDRDRCLEAGMDDYVSKPVTAQELFETIEAQAQGRTKAESRLARSKGNDVIDEAALMARVDNDTKLLNKMIELFCDDAPKMLSKLKKCIAAGDTETVASVSHTLGGSASNFASEGVIEAAHRLEKMARENEMANADEAITLLEQELGYLIKALSAISGRTRGKRR